MISCVGRADIERDTSMDRSRERNLVGRIRTCALTGTSRWDGLRAALPSPVPLWRNRAMPGMPARQRGPCRWCHARKATGAMPVVPSRHRRMPSRHRGHTGDDSRHRGAPSRHRGHALGAAYLNEFGHARLASVTACDRGGGKRTWREHSRALSGADRELRRVARHD